MQILVDLANQPFALQLACQLLESTLPHIAKQQAQAGQRKVFGQTLKGEGKCSREKNEIFILFFQKVVAAVIAFTLPLPSHSPCCCYRIHPPAAIAFTLPLIALIPTTPQTLTLWSRFWPV